MRKESKVPKGLRSLSWMFAAIGVAMAVVMVWALFGKFRPDSGDASFVPRMQWFIVWGIIAAGYVFCAALFRSGKRIVWWCAVVLCILLIGSVVLAPFLIIGLFVLTRRNTRRFFKIGRYSSLANPSGSAVGE